MRLNLAENNFGAKGTQAFARGLADSSYLKSLDISYPKIEAEAIKQKRIEITLMNFYAQ